MVGVTADSVTRLPPSVTEAGPTGSGVTPSPSVLPSDAPDIDQFVFNDEFDVSGNGNLANCVDIWVRPGGTDLYLNRETISGANAFQFSMSPGHILSSMAFHGQDFPIAQSPRGIAVRGDDGSSYFLNTRNPTNPDGFFRWPLPTPWDITSRVVNDDNRLIYDLGNNPRGIWFSSDGTKMFSLDTSGPAWLVYQWNLPAAWTLEPNPSPGPSFDLSGEVAGAVGLTFSSDGRKMYVADNINDDIEQYNLSTAFDVSTAVYANKTLSLNNGTGTDPRGIAMMDDHLYVIYEDNPNYVEQYCLPGFPEVDEWVFDAAYLFAAQSVAQCRYVPDGSRVYARTNTNQSTDFIRYNTPDYSVPFVPENDASPTSGQAFPNDGTEGFDFGSDGTKVYISRSGGNRMREYINNGTPYKFQTGDLVLNFDMAGVNRALDVAMLGSGLKLIYLDSANQLIRSITMTLPDDLSTGAVDAATFDPSNENASMGSLDVSPDGVSLYLRGLGNIIYEYEFGTPGDVSTLTYTGRSLDVTSDLPVGSTSAVGVSVSPNNQHMVVVARNGTVPANNYFMHYTR
jgi:hypothetical protein